MRDTIALPKPFDFRRQFTRFVINEYFISIIIFLYYFITNVWEIGCESCEATAWERFGEAVLMLNHIGLVILVNYVLIPRYFHQRKYWIFFGLVVLGILLVSTLEEGFWEKIFYPAHRGSGALGIDDIRRTTGEIAPFVFALFGFKITWDYHDEQRRVEELKSKRLNSELKFLKSQINPHVLFNNLNNIYSYALENSKHVPDMVLKLSDIMRYMLYECDEDFVPLKKEINYLTNFVRLQEIQMEGRGEVNFKVIGDPEGYRIAPLLLIAFVENCFKHSMQTKIEDIQINITIRIIDGVFDFFAENNFGEEIKLEDREGGIGLQNVKKRLELIYGDNAELHYEKGPEQFWVSLRIHLL